MADNSADIAKRITLGASIKNDRSKTSTRANIIEMNARKAKAKKAK